ncbi:hypothetical protein BV898_15185 [Hypsibius exemplaris]|uniref:Uncharacterized protein n=1 Tax=Hypsibius exemplaris TaxID=2072580 RepID=A0A9X6RK65_HYPEX|nr:hypothetical protein BV898_15185 [Hypsibius exemplaris]
MELIRVQEKSELNWSLRLCWQHEASVNRGLSYQGLMGETIYHNRLSQLLEFVQFFLEAGCPDISPAVFLKCFRCCAYITLTAILKLHLQCGRVLLLPENNPPAESSTFPPTGPKTSRSSSHIRASAALLQDWIHRCLDRIGPSRAAVRHLFGVTGGKNCTEVSSLVDLSISTLRRMWMANERSFSRPVADGISLPHCLMRNLNLLELEKRLATLMELIYAGDN